MTNKKKNIEWKTPRKIFLVFLFLMFILFGRYCFLALSPTINGRDMEVFAANRNTVSRVLTAKRGTIYDTTGNVLAQNVTSYTLIAYLDEDRSTKNQINHVKDIDATAKALAPILNADEEDLKSKLTFDLKLTTESGKEYTANIVLDFPVAGVVENGTTSLEITDLKDLVFKRTKN